MGYATVERHNRQLPPELLFLSNAVCTMALNASVTTFFCSPLIRELGLLLKSIQTPASEHFRFTSASGAPWRGYFKILWDLGPSHLTNCLSPHDVLPEFKSKARCYCHASIHCLSPCSILSLSASWLKPAWRLIWGKWSWIWSPTYMVLFLVFQ